MPHRESPSTDLVEGPQRSRHFGVINTRLCSPANAGEIKTTHISCHFEMVIKQWSGPANEGEIKTLHMSVHFETVIKQWSGPADAKGIRTSHTHVYSRRLTGHTEEGDEYMYISLFTAAKSLRTYALPLEEPALPLAEPTTPLADPCTLPTLGAALALLLWQMLQVAADG